MGQLMKLLLLCTLVIVTACSNKNRPLYRIQENGLFGFIDSTGNVVIKPKYKYVGDFNKDGYATVISDFKCSYKENFLNETDTILIITYGFIDKDDNLVVDTINRLKLSKSEQYRMGYYSTKELVDSFNSYSIGFISTNHDEFIKLEGGMYLYQDSTNLKMGYRNLKGEITIPAKYTCCHPFYNGVAIVTMTADKENRDVLKLLNNQAIIDESGHEIMNEGYIIIRDFYRDCNKSWALKLTNENDYFVKQWILLDNKGNACSDPIDGDNAIIFNSKGDMYMCQLNLEIMGNRIGSYYTFVNDKGEFATDYDHNGKISFGRETFEDVTSLIDSIVGIKVSYDETPAWAFANERFEFKSQPFDSVFQFKEGLAAVKEFSKNKKSKWGFVDKNFKEVIAYKYDEIRSFRDGLAYFKASNIQGYINKNGDVVWSTIGYK